MSKWDIDPQGVSGVVTKTGDVAKGFEPAAKKFVSALQGGATSGGSQIVAEAIKGFADHHEKTLTGIADRTVRVLTGAVEATKAYLHADLEMAEQAQRNATL
jgi:hypothetical protein